jgi:membrane-associated protease RseP (regulator of RpoE activity)
MKTMLRMMGCISVVLLLTTGTILGASGRLSSGTQKKEKVKISGWIGVMVQDVNAKIVRKVKLDSEEGAYVKEVLEDSPADSAGIQESDVIIEFNGKKLFDSDDLVKAVRRTLPNTKVNLVLVRDGEKKTLYLIVGKKKEPQHCMFGGMPKIPNVHVFAGNHILGLRLLVLNEQLGEYFGAPNNEGVLVEEVEHKSMAEKAGFKAGDIIIRVGKKTVDAVEKIQRELQKNNEGDIVEFEVIRKSAKKILNVELEEQQYFHKNFFFPKPHIQMFRTDPSDDTEIQLDIDEPQIELDQVQKEIEKSTRNFKGWNNEI